jgi:CheY-like chemotaxis protein
MTSPQELGRRPWVLLVDDDAENRRLVREVLQAEGLSVIGEAGDGVAAVQITLEAGPDVVLMDLRMPVMGGIEATRLIKKASAHTQVIVLTSYEGPLPERSASEVGAYAYLVKDCGSGLIRDVILQAWKHKWGLDQRSGSSS